MPSLGMGRIFTIGSTAAMAWILPHEPMVFLDKKEKKKNDQMMDLGNQEEENMPDQFYQSYYENHETLDNTQKYYDFGNYDRISRHQLTHLPKNHHETYEYHHIEPEHYHIYRRTRRSLYGKLEKLLDALSKNGRSCILKIICEVSQIANRKGSFMEEIIKVIFRIKIHRGADEDAYDGAANENHNCKDRYRNCPWSYFDKLQ